MNDTQFFLHSHNSFAFLTVCHYINNIGFLLAEEYPNIVHGQSVSILNAFFEQLNKSKNETKTKHDLLREILKETDLDEGTNSSILEEQYVTDTFQYIISGSLFAHYGGITRYLSSLISTSNNLTFSSFKTQVEENLETFKSDHHCQIPMNVGSSRNINRNMRNSWKKLIHETRNESNTLTKLSIRKIFNDHIWSIFPEPNEKNISILNITYMYALAGLKIARTLRVDSNLTFNDFILLSRTVKIESTYNASYNSALQFFSVPALFFYAYSERENFEQEDTKYEWFWKEAYSLLFRNLNENEELIVEKIIKESLYYKLQTEFTHLRSRTEMAADILISHCQLHETSDLLPLYIRLYKISGPNLNIFSLCQNLPNLEEQYNAQFSETRKIYFEIEQNSILEIFTAGGLMSEMNLQNTKVLQAKFPNHDNFCIIRPPKIQKPKNIIYLMFAIKKRQKIKFFALKVENNDLHLLVNKGYEEIFAEELGVDFKIRPEVAAFAKPLKNISEKCDKFIRRLAEMKTDEYMNGLTNFYYDITTEEQVLNFLVNLVPFYTCVQETTVGDLGFGIFSCSLDVISLIPLVGVAAKYSTIIGGRFSFEVQKSLSTFLASLSKSSLSAGAVLRIGLSKVIQAAIKTVTGEIPKLTKPFLIDLAIGTIRTLDPGFELSYKISKFGIHFFKKIFTLKFMKQLYGLSKLPTKLREMFEGLSQFNVDNTGMVARYVDKFMDHDIVKYTYLGGDYEIGPKCLKAFDRVAELRSLEIGPFRTFVVPSKKYDYYRAINLKSGHLSDYKFMLNDNDLLSLVQDSEKSVQLKISANEFHNDVREFTLKVQEPGEVENLAGDKYLRPTGTKPKGGSRKTVVISADDDVPTTSKGAISKEYSFFTAEDAVRKIVFKTGLSEKEVGHIVKNYLLSTRTSHPSIPTYYQFANDFSSSVGVSMVYEKYKLKHEHEMMTYFVPDKPRYILFGSKFTNSINEIKETFGPDFETYYQVDFKIATKLYTSIPEMNLNFRDLCLILALREKGLPFIKQNQLMLKHVRIALGKLVLKQIDDSRLLSPVELCFSEIVDRSNIIHKLKRLESKTFFFNDITMAKKNDPGVFDMSQLRPISLDTKVVYQMKFDTHFGVLSLGSIHSHYLNEYIIFPDARFIVKQVDNTNKKLLVLDMEVQPYSMEDWKINRIREFDSLLETETLTPRAQSIAKAVDFVVSRVPLQTIEMTENVFRSYLFHYGPSPTISVPTYDTAATAWANSLKMPSDYSLYYFKNNKLIDDILFKENLDEIQDVNEALQRIEIIDKTMSKELVKKEFNTYIKTPIIKNNIKFEDYYVIRSMMENKLWMNLVSLRRIKVAFTRLTLRQCDQNFPREPVQLFYSNINYRRYEALNLKKFDRFTFDYPELASELKENVNTKIKKLAGPSHRVFFNIDVKYPHGVLDFGRYFNSDKGKYVICADVPLVVDKVSSETVNGHSILIFNMHVSETPKEKIMSLLIKQLETMFKTNIKFYAP